MRPFNRTDVAADTPDGGFASPTNGLARLLQRLRKSLAVRRQRNALLALDDRMLSDIGISRTDAYRETQRPFLDTRHRGE